LQIKIKIVSCHAADSKPVKQEVQFTVILPPLVFPTLAYLASSSATKKKSFITLTPGRRSRSPRRARKGRFALGQAVDRGQGPRQVWNPAADAVPQGPML
jgi:hypothetical protein